MGDKKVHTSRNSINMNLNVIIQLKFELEYNDLTVQYFGHLDSQSILLYLLRSE